MNKQLSFTISHKLKSSLSTSRQNWTKPIRTEGEQNRKDSTDLQADRQVDPAAEGGADSSGVESQILKEFGEGLGQGCPGTLLCYHHAGPDPGQVQPSRLKIRKIQHQTFYDRFHQSF